ncbi:MAG: cupin domain-containing protein [Anaerolineaceae bacterium]|jgi:quercetin dioxygenase-like cupin family protein|nr:MAG: cupin domain-containing protein [Anaerolineaceae bacterium]
MKIANLLENQQFGKDDSHAEPLHADPQGRAILYTLKAGQSIREHNAPSSTFFMVVPKGKGVFTEGDGVERTCGANMLLVFDAGESHTVRAPEKLVFVGVLHGAPDAQK